MQRSSCGGSLAWYPRTLAWLGLTVAVAWSAEPPTVPEATAKNGKATPYQVAPFVHRLWAITGAVLEQHVAPPTRQEMFLAAARHLCLQTQDPSAQLSQKLSRLTTEEQFVALFEEIWPKTARQSGAAEELEKGTLAALLESVPGQPRVLSALQLKAIADLHSNRYVGLGIQIRLAPEEKLSQIVTTMPGGTARAAGVKAGDLIVEADGFNMEGQTISQVVMRLRGEEGSSVTLKLRQPGSTENRTLKMERRVVPFETVLGYQRSGENSFRFRVDPVAPIAYLRFSSLSSSTVHELRKLEGQLLEEGFRGVVLDLRFTGTGDTHLAALVADALLDGGVMWRERDTHHRLKEHRADRDCLFRDCRLAVLVNNTMELPAQLVAAALQDNNRAVLIGERSNCEAALTSQVHLPENQGEVLLRTGWVERSRPGAPRPADQEAQGQNGRYSWLLVPNHEVLMTNRQKEDLMEWNHQQHSPDLSSGPYQYPQDPQLTKAVAVLREDLKKTDKSEPRP